MPVSGYNMKAFFECFLSLLLFAFQKLFVKETLTCNVLNDYKIFELYFKFQFKLRVASPKVIVIMGK